MDFPCRSTFQLEKKHFKSVSGWPERQLCLELAVNIMVQPGILKSSILLEAFKPTLVLICQSFHLRSDCDCPCYVVSLLEHLWKHHPSAPVPAGHFEPWKIKNIPKRREHVRNGIVTLYNLAPRHRSHPSSLHPTSHRLVEELFLAIRLPNDWNRIVYVYSIYIYIYVYIYISIYIIYIYIYIL